MPKDRKFDRRQANRILYGVRHGKPNAYSRTRRQQGRLSTQREAQGWAESFSATGAVQ